MRGLVGGGWGRAVSVFGRRSTESEPGRVCLRAGGQAPIPQQHLPALSPSSLFLSALPQFSALLLGGARSRLEARPHRCVDGFACGLPKVVDAEMVARSRTGRGFARSRVVSRSRLLLLAEETDVEPGCVLG